MPSRVEILKTYKLYIGGKFPRTESGRYYQWNSPSSDLQANICLGSRKDFRNAVVAARAAQGGWSKQSAFNKGQVMYRMAEMMEGRSAQFIAELIKEGLSPAKAKEETMQCIDRLLYYAGWSDKYSQIFSSVNPVASSHFNFSIPEPTGVVAIFAPQNAGLLGLISTVAPAIIGGNSVVVLASKDYPLSAITFAEVLNDSDLPGGVVNILTGQRNELLEHFASHMDVNSVVYCENDTKEITKIREIATLNVKRAIVYDHLDWYSAEAQSPYQILDFQETKTTWHPIGV